MFKGPSVLGVSMAYLQCVWFPVGAARCDFAQFFQGTQEAVTGSTGNRSNVIQRESSSLNFEQAELPRILCFLLSGSGEGKNVS